ncbi:MAG: glycosyltransferase family 2 protein [Chitinispirillia bacterium]|nr:glycosyltransferase family 2 protein [Chitinispirillia bacterium]MCL2269592.1 glycosyltransferase family 2 protein [Chitinispirillia bacterium]
MIEWPSGTYVLIPSYKSAGQLKQFLNMLFKIVPKDHVLIVDDASRDGTYEYCLESDIMCLRHDVNRGKGAALKTGFAYLTAGSRAVNASAINAKWILTMDADGQHSLSDIPRFLEMARKWPHTGICIGARDMRIGAMPPTRILSNRLTSLILTLLTGQRIKDSQCGYRLYSGPLAASTHLKYNRFQMESEVILKTAAKKIPITFVRVQTLYLKGGRSHISHLIDTVRWAVAVFGVWYGIRFKGNINGKSGKSA